MTKTPDRCRLILVMGADVLSDTKTVKALVNRSSDVACAIITMPKGQEFSNFDVYQQALHDLQASDIACLIENNQDLALRWGADGVLVNDGFDALKPALDRFSPQNIVGYGGAESRHEAMAAGELQPDFLLFGRLDGDREDEPHPKVLALGQWWSEMFEIPCAVMIGQNLNSLVAAAQTGAEFAVVAKAFWQEERDIEAKLNHANQLLDDHAPSFS